MILLCYIFYSILEMFLSKELVLYLTLILYTNKYLVEHCNFNNKLMLYLYYIFCSVKLGLVLIDYKLQNYYIYNICHHIEKYIYKQIYKIYNYFNNKRKEYIVRKRLKNILDSDNICHTTN